jgi:hypothetical protein
MRDLTILAAWLALLLRLENFRETHPEFRLLRDNLEEFGRARVTYKYRSPPENLWVAMHDWFLNSHKTSLQQTRSILTQMLTDAYS